MESNNKLTATNLEDVSALVARVNNLSPKADDATLKKILPARYFAQIRERSRAPLGATIYREDAVQAVIQQFLSDAAEGLITAEDLASLQS